MNIIMINDDIAFCNTFASLFANQSVLNLIGVTNDTSEAFELLCSKQPHTLILSLELQDGIGNGFSFLKSISEIALPAKPYIIVITNNTSQRTHDIARKLGADFIMSKHNKSFSPKEVFGLLETIHRPTTNSSSYVCAKLSNSELPAMDRAIKQKIDEEFYHIGISPRLTGYKYLVDSIQLVLDKPPDNLAVAIATIYGKTEGSVARAMQTAIDSAWNTSDLETLLQHYTAKTHSSKGVPTPTEFVYYYANKLKEK